MNVSSSRPVRDDGLNRTTLSIGRGLPMSSIGTIVQALQRVPGVLTVDADTENAQAVVAHDAAVPAASLVAAASRAGAAANVVAAATCAAVAPDENGKPQTMQGHRLLATVGVVAMLAVIVIDFALPNNPEKRWFFVIPVILLWAFIVLRAAAARRS